MDLICYLTPEWKPLVRPAAADREWMDQTKHSFAYRCLPLNIANAHGWEILTPIAFDAMWLGGSDKSDVVIRPAEGADPAQAPVSAFGEGVLTFHVHALFRTPPGWNLWVGGSPNRPKDGIYPLTGVIETDWSPYTFTMNWRFTRRNHSIHFDAGEPICFVFPVQRAALETVRPRFLPIESEPQMAAHYLAWQKSRSDFLEMMRQERRPVAPVDQWQKRYYRGTDMTDQPVVVDHKSKLRLAEFEPMPQGSDADPDLSAPVILETDTHTLGRAIGRIAAAINSGSLKADRELVRLAKSLTVLGLGEAEALEMIAEASDHAGGTAT
jgi:Family of unknown function (DUF6065)